MELDSSAEKNYCGHGNEKQVNE